MAGGSCTAIPVKDEAFLAALSTMKPVESGTEGVYTLIGEKGIVYYKQDASPLHVVLEPSTGYSLYEIGEKTGTVTPRQQKKGSATIDGKGIFWLKTK